MKNLFRTTVILSLLLSVFAYADPKVEESTPIKTTVEQVLAKRAEHDNKVVEVAGHVVGFRQRTSRIGNAYFTFRLQTKPETATENRVFLNIYSQGTAPEGLANGKRVVVTGTYRQEKKMRDFTVKDEVDASAVEGKPFGVKIVP
ncbi:MAG: hypothetical protein SNJ74_00110 [Fimbriimonadaceae bacterium]